MRRIAFGLGSAQIGSLIAGSAHCLLAIPKFRISIVTSDQTPALFCISILMKPVSSGVPAGVRTPGLRARQARQVRERFRVTSQVPATTKVRPT